jgi:hypothetical protein
VPHPVRLQSVASGTFMDLNGGSPNDGIKNIASGLLKQLMNVCLHRYPDSRMGAPL